MRDFLTRVIVLLVATAVLAPTAFFVRAPKAEAYLGNLDSNLMTDLQTMYTAVKGTITAAQSITSAAANYAMYIKEYVLEPLSFITSGNLLRSLTAGVIDYVNGKTNGTGQPQYVQNLPGHLQGVGDTQAVAFLLQFGKHSKSPFTGSVVSSLRTNYYQETSLAGYFAKNRETLPQFSKNPRAFLSGNWSQGGAAAWMALTTQPQNNPYVMHERAQEELALVVHEQTAARLNELAWGGGYLSWCGGTAAKNSCKADDGSAGTLGEDGSCASNTNSSQDKAASPVAGDSCIKKDGTLGTIQTPGSTIKASLDKALGLTGDKLVALGNAATQINGIMQNISTVMDTVNMASSILGSASLSTATGGLLGSDTSRPDGSSFMGVTPTGVTQGAGDNPAFNGQQFLETVDEYEALWKKIAAPTNAASSSLITLTNYLLVKNCNIKIGTVDLTVAVPQAAMANYVRPQLLKIEAASTTVAKARAFVAKLKADSAAGDPTLYAQDLATLQIMSPTAKEVAAVQQDVISTAAPDKHDNMISRAVADPAGSFNIVAGDGTAVDRMNLIKTNADALLLNCQTVQTNL